MATHAVTDDSFDTEVRKSDIPVVVDFWAEWCGPCKQIGPALEEISEEMAGKVKVVKVNVDENMQVAASLNVRGIPALFLFKDGEVVSNKTGAATARSRKSPLWKAAASPRCSPTAPTPSRSCAQAAGVAPSAKATTRPKIFAGTGTKARMDGTDGMKAGNMGKVLRRL